MYLIKYIKKIMRHKNKFLETPNLPLPQTLNQGIPENQLDELETYENIYLSNCQLEGNKGVSFNCTYLDNVKVVNTYFKRLDLQDTQINKSDFANTELEEAALNRVEFVNCRLLGFRAIKSRFKNVLFKDCQAELSQFNFTKFERVIFENCILKDAIFSDTLLKDVKFINCQMDNVALSNAKFNHTDFRGSEIEGLQININQLQGAIVDIFQAGYILQRYTNVIVKTVDEIDIK
jgi:uncharacterized protein YjbI with pentapeptide repeats